MTNDDKQEALDDLMQIAGSLNSLSQAFCRTGNQAIADELQWLKTGIVRNVEIIKTVDREESNKETQRLNQLTGSLLTALLDKESNNEP